MAHLPDQRRRELAQIHIGAKALGMDVHDESPDCEYRRMLWTRGRVRSSKDLDHAGRAAVLDHLKACGWQAAAGAGNGRRHEWAWVDRAAADRQPMLRKIIAILKPTGRGKAYADGVAKRLYGVDDIKFCGTAQLHGIVSALVKDAARRAARPQAGAR